MKTLRTLIVAALTGCVFLSAALVPPVDAQRSARISWDGCDPIVINKDFTVPGPYTLVVSGTDWAGSYRGYQFDILLRPENGSPYPDAWRFDSDPGACQGPANLIVAPVAGDVDCPPLVGQLPLFLTSMDYEYPGDPPQSARLIMGIVYETVQGDPAERFGFWQVVFNHAASVTGPSSTGTCGGAEVPMCLELVYASYIDENDQPRFDIVLENEFVTWNLPAGTTRCGAVTPAEPRTWGALKSQYR